jgi:hypothetical protein
MARAEATGWFLGRHRDVAGDRALLGRESRFSDFSGCSRDSGRSMSRLLQPLEHPSRARNNRFVQLVDLRRAPAQPPSRKALVSPAQVSSRRGASSTYIQGDMWPPRTGRTRRVTNEA